jgi:hypothetical protein
MIVVGTADGLVELALDGTVIRQALAGVQVEGISGDWAVAEGRVVSLATGSVVELPGDLVPTAVLAGPRARALVGTEGAHLVPIGGPGRPLADGAFEAAAGRRGWASPWGGAPVVRSLAAGAEGPLVGVHVGGVWRSEGDGWAQAVPPEAQVLQVAAADGVVAVGAATGVGLSTDGGRSWDWSDQGLPGAYCRAVALADGWLVAAVAPEQGARRSVLVRRPVGDAGRGFVRCGDSGKDDLPDTLDHLVDTFALAAEGPNVALGTPGGDLCVSRDSGATWDIVADSLPGVGCVAVRPAAGAASGAGAATGHG